MVVPIEGGRACDNIRVRQDRRVAVGREILARLKQQDAALRVGTQSRREDGARRTAAYNNHVEGCQHVIRQHFYKVSLSLFCFQRRLLAFGDYLRQKPGSALGLVDPVLDQAGGGDVVVLFAEFMGRT
jgi:hypothetical protein